MHPLSPLAGLSSQHAAAGVFTCPSSATRPKCDIKPNEQINMCGIIGYTGSRDSVPILVSGLKRMEYRGYDSAGVAVNTASGIVIRKDAGKVTNLEKLLQKSPVRGSTGIGHTRWATHGVPNQVNAHPHTDDHGSIVLVHNGIIENYNSLRTELRTKGHVFTTDTDTEVIAHLIAEFYSGVLLEAVQRALSLVRGTYGLAILSSSDPGTIIAARLGSPMVIGHGTNENFIASDPAAFMHYTRDVSYWAMSRSIRSSNRLPLISPRLKKADFRISC
jgi:glucosamine--fructose-6-phosphate aminotransferase (isomerizing)